MTRKDYILIAAALKEALPPDTMPFPVSGPEMHADIAENLCRALARDNPRFDRERFLRAAGVSFMEQCSEISIR